MTWRIRYLPRPIFLFWSAHLMPVDVPNGVDRDVVAKPRA